MKTLVLDPMRFQIWKGLPISSLLLSGFIIALLIGSSGCSDSDRRDGDDKLDGPLVVRNSCPFPSDLPWPPSHTDVAILADRILRSESDELLFDPKERNELIEDIGRILPLIREAYPQVAEIPARPTHLFGRLSLILEPGLYQTIEGILSTEEEFVTLKTGNAEFDALTTRLELQGIALASSILHRVSICFEDRLNIKIASDTYSRVAGVRLVNLVSIPGDGPDIIATKVDGRWLFIFRNAWGDCPESCGYQELFFFTVEGDQVQQITEAMASTMLPFQKLLLTRSW